MNILLANTKPYNTTSLVPHNIQTTIPNTNTNNILTNNADKIQCTKPYQITNSNLNIKRNSKLNRTKVD